ncbi:eukaryotic mitochondrial regulator protein-domain-containing protein [Epithele typhae]|uniref:eukaryotic mitochondrial regulator protein-domain-containing protein n=1 Tax=Epithele typhae TaxID=378194 RepID=UPI002007E680|nr:eukaryotic mitochondrial regulator protein-domain-containing protein [Epithele typhae]KAH9931995.1 eukaryotic mitochondrial regulator protein-domain-containing protein [Epithele typhae]
MLSHLARASRRPARFSSLSVPAVSNAPRRTYADIVAPDKDEENAGRTVMTFEQWRENVAERYKYPTKPKNWMGNVPFPQNETFKPPPPVSDAVRQAIWQEYMAKPTDSTIRMMAHHHGLALSRIDAILRLKGLENQWKECCVAGLTECSIAYGSAGEQADPDGLLKNMEYILGVSSKISSRPRDAGISFGDDAVESDLVSEVASKVARDRYQRLFWEATVDGEGGGTVVADRIAAREAKEEVLKSKEVLEPALVIEREGRTSIKFVDVGLKFMDLKDRVKRVKAAHRRKQMKQKRRDKAAAAAPAASPEVASAPA